MSLFALQPTSADDEKCTKEKVFQGGNVADQGSQNRFRARSQFAASCR
jgi:hypothetical protein